MLVLSASEKLAIVAGSVGLVSLVTMATMCFVCPVCCMYKRLRRKSKDEEVYWKDREDVYIGDKQDRNSQTYHFRDPPPPYEQWRPKSQPRGPPIELARLQSTSSCSSVCSSNTSEGYLSTINELDNDLVFKEPKYGMVVLGFSYVPSNEVIRGQLTVHIKEAHGLPLRPYGTRCHPYLVIELTKSKGHRFKSSKKHNTILRFETAVVQKSLNPIYNETHTLAILDKDMNRGSLRIVVWDKEKWSNDTALGEARIPLKELTSMLGSEPNYEQTVELQLQETKLSNGEILVGLCYLPTAERIVLAILKLNNLKMVKENDLQSAYIQAMSVYGGRVMEKRKTSARPSTSLQVFNEMLMFDVPSSKLDNVVLIVAVKLNAPQNDVTEDINDHAIKDQCVGKVLIGTLCKRSGHHHWTAMKNAPRRQIIQWHDLI